MGPLDKYVLADDALTATPDGFDLRFRSHWYRSLPLSCMGVKVQLDGAELAPEDITLEANGHHYALSELPNLSEEWLFILDAATLHLKRPTASPAGQAHQVALTLDLYIPYILVGAEGSPLLASTRVAKSLISR